MNTANKKKKEKIENMSFISCGPTQATTGLHNNIMPIYL